MSSISSAEWCLSLSRALRNGDKPKLLSLVEYYQHVTAGPVTAAGFHWAERSRSLVAKSADRQRPFSVRALTAGLGICAPSVVNSWG